MPTDPGMQAAINPSPERLAEAPSAAALALLRLSASRERLAQRLLPATQPPRAAPRASRGARAQPGAGPAAAFDSTAGDTGPTAGDDRWPDTWPGWRAKLETSPLGPLLDTGRTLLDSWWQRQPWRSTAEAVGGELRTTVGPLVQRHPWGTVLLSAGVAAAVVWLRPWRAGWLRPHVQPLPRRAGAWLLGQASLLPWQAVLPALLAAWRLSQPPQPPQPPDKGPAPATAAAAGATVRAAAPAATPPQAVAP